MEKLDISLLGRPLEYEHGKFPFLNKEIGISKTRRLNSVDIKSSNTRENMEKRVENRSGKWHTIKLP